MRFLDNYISLFFMGFFALLLGWSAVLYFTGQRTTEWNYLYNAVNALMFFSAGVVALFGIKLHGLKSAVGKELLSIALAMFGFSLGLFIWCYYNLITKVGVPYPSLADVFMILYIPLLGYGISNLLHAFGFMYSKKIFVESLCLFIVTGTILFFVGNPPDLSSNTSFIAKTLNILYLVGDAYLISLGYMLIRLTRGRIHASFFYLVGGLFAMAAADLVFAHRTGTETYWNGDISDLLYSFSGLLFSLGVVRIVSSQLKISFGTKKME